MKKLVVIAVMMAVLAGIAYAQGAPSGWWTDSPQSTATQGRYRSNADNFIRPDAFTGVSFEKYFAMASFANSSNAQIGYATKLGNTYTALAYSGNFWATNRTLNYIEAETDWFNSSKKTIPFYDELPILGNNAINNVHLLIGLADMGFRFSFRSTQQSFSENDFYVDSLSVLYKNYEEKNGQIAPHIAWSLTKDLTPNGIKPYVFVTLAFNNNYSKFEVYKNDGTTDGTQVGKSQNNFTPTFEIGLGGYNLYRTEGGFRLSADVTYNLQIISYNNDYHYMNSSGKYEIASIKGLNAGTLTENSQTQHIIEPTLAGQWSGGPLALRLQLRMPITIRNTEKAPMIFDSASPNTGILVKDGEVENISYFGFAPQLRLATQWKIVPKLTLNAGGRITLTTLSTTTVKYQEYDNGKKVETNGFYKEITKSFGAPNNLTNNLTVGVSFFPTDNMTFEAACGVGTNNAISVFSDTGLFNFTSLLVSLKF